LFVRRQLTAATTHPETPDEEATVAETENKAIFRRFYEGAWNRDDLAAVEELLAPNFINHELPAEISAPHRELYKRAIIENPRFFPDWTLVIEDLIAEGERVVARWTGQGTHAAEGPKPAFYGKCITTHGITIIRVVDSRITDFWKS